MIMKNRIATQIGTCIGIFALLLAMVVIPAQARELKLGVVNPGRVLEKIPHTQEARKRIEREFSSRTREIKGQQQELRKLEEKFQRDGAIMGQSKRDRLEREVLTLKRSLKRDIDELREDRSLRENQELSELQTRIVEVIQAIGKEGRYDLILVDGVIYADKGVDITDNVVSRLTDEFKRSSKDRGSKR
jgi:outer membrane protein